MLISTNQSLNLSIPSGLDENSLREFFDQVCLLDPSKVKNVYLNCSQLEDVTSRHITVICHSMFECEKKGISCKLIAVTDSMLIAVKHLKLNDLLLLEDSDKTVFNDTSKISIKSRDVANVLRLEFMAEKEAIKANLGKFKDFLNKFNLTEKTEYELATVFYEIAMNIKQHGYNDNPDRILFKAEVLDNEISMRFKDSGKKFDPTQLVFDYDPEISIKNGRKRGLGLILINRIIDNMTYFRENGAINRLVLVKKLFGEI